MNKKDETQPPDLPKKDETLPPNLPKKEETLPPDLPKKEETLPPNLPKKDETLPPNIPKKDETLPPNLPKKDATLPPNLPKKALGIRLLNCVRDKKYKEATSLLEHEPDMTVKDAAGWKALHFAALEGNVEMIELLLKSGAVVECWDNNGQSPLHKAARRGHLEAVVSLVNHGAAFPLDWKGQTPLQLSVIEKHTDIVQMLCSFGAYVPPEDWSFMTEDKSAKMKQIKEILKTQRSILTDFEYRKIIWKTLKIEKEETEIPELELTVNSKDLNKHFYLYIAKKTEFTEFINYVNVLREEHELFSDLYECQVWRTSERILELKIKIDGVPGILHDLVIVSQEPGAARIANFNIENQQTTVTVAVTIRQMKKVTFALLLKEKQPEVFQVSQGSKIITPVAEPESEITIPEGTFEEPVELKVEFVETKSVNEEEIDGPILLTNVLDVTLSEGSTMASGKELTMKLPIHEKNEGKEDDIVVLVTSEEYPECSDDWEVIEAKSRGQDGSVVFSVNHLSIFVGASKDKVSKDKDEVVDAIERSLDNMCKATFIGFLKLEDEKVLTIVVECATPKRAEKREKKWQKKGFKELFPKSDKLLISNTEIFKLDFLLCPNLKDPTDSSNSLQFQRKKQNYLVKELHIIDNTVDIHGEIKVDLEKRTEVQLVEVGCFKKKNNSIKTKTKITYNHLTDLEFDIPKAYICKPVAEKAKNYASSTTGGGLDVPNANTEQDKVKDSEAEPGTSKSSTEESTTDASSKTDGHSNQNAPEDNIPQIQKLEFDADTISEIKTYPDTIPALRWSSLKELASALSEEEAEHIAIQLDLKRGDVEELQNTLNKQYGMAFLVFKHWRDSTQSLMRVKKLQDALIAIGREDLAIAFRQAHMDDVPFRKEDIGAKKRFRLA